MSGPYLALYVSLLHSNPLSVIVLEVYVTRVAARKRKCQPPILINLHGPCAGTVSFELMKTEVWQGDILQTTGSVDHVKPITQPHGEFWRNSSLAIGFEEITQAFMPK